MHFRRVRDQERLGALRADYCYSKYFAHPHVEAEQAYLSVVVGRGHEPERLTTRDMDQLVIFRTVH